jgi:hypothetical protein
MATAATAAAAAAAAAAPMDLLVVKSFIVSYLSFVCYLW